MSKTIFSIDLFQLKILVGGLDNHESHHVIAIFSSLHIVEGNILESQSNDLDNQSSDDRTQK